MVRVPTALGFMWHSARVAVCGSAGKYYDHPYRWWLFVDGPFYEVGLDPTV